MAAPDASPVADESRQSTGSGSSRGLDKVELSDLDASPPPLPLEQDLMQLARLGELRAIQKLFDSGRYTARSTDDQGITALHWAAINGHHALCHFLIQSGADVNAKGGEAQAPPVLWASKRFHLPVVSLLLANGADPLICDDSGYNLLHSATLDGNIFQLILLLYQPDIPVDVPDAHGHTSLMWAAYKGFPQCVDMLLRSGADVHAKDDMGFTALHWALVKGSYLCIQKLVEHGSDRFAVSKPQSGQESGDSPAMTAAKMKSGPQWHKALVDSGFAEDGSALAFPIPGVKNRWWFYKRFWFFWPFALGGLQLYMLAHMLVWIGFPAVLLVGYTLQYLVAKLNRWAPSDMKGMHQTPLLAGIFAGSLFWVGVRYVFCILPNTLFSHFLLNLAFAACYGLCTYFYFTALAADPGYIPKGASRGQTKRTIDELIEHEAFNESHFCTTCMIRKPLRSKHCQKCRRCVARIDHHCPWVDNCVAVNNHKHFLLYVMFLVFGIILLIPLTIDYIEILPPPVETHCAILGDVLCAQYSKDPLTIVTVGWGALQLSWTFLLLFVQLFQVAQNRTTYESMRHSHQVGPLLSAVTTGTLSTDAAQVTADGAGPLPHSHDHRHPHSHNSGQRKQQSCFGRWASIIGLDTFLVIAFQGYRRTREGNAGGASTRRRANPFSRGVFRNCQDFWSDGPVFGHKESGKALVGGEAVDYSTLYDVPRGGAMQYRRGGGYEEVARDDDEV